MENGGEEAHRVDKNLGGGTGIRCAEVGAGCGEGKMGTQTASLELRLGLSGLGSEA